MPTLSEVAKQWASELVGTEVAGIVADAESGEQAAYHMRCTSVSWSGFGDRIAVVWDDQLAGTAQRWERAADADPKTFASALEASVRENLAVELEANRYAGLVGEEL